MASYSMEEFLGDGLLKSIIPKLVEEGCDDVPTLKMMNLEDTDSMKLTQHQKVGCSIFLDKTNSLDVTFVYELTVRILIIF